MRRLASKFLEFGLTSIRQAIPIGGVTTWGAVRRVGGPRCEGTPFGGLKVTWEVLGALERLFGRPKPATATVGSASGLP